LLTTVAAIRALPRAEAQKHYPIRFEAVVTLCNAQSASLFVQDQTAGIYVEAWRHLHQMNAGDRVEVEGQSAAGDYAPIVDYPRVRVLGHGELPAPRRIALEEFVTGQQDSQWIEIEGIVRAVQPDRIGTRMTVLVGATRVSTKLNEIADPAVLAPLIGA